MDTLGIFHPESRVKKHLFGAAPKSSLGEIFGGPWKPLNASLSWPLGVFADVTHDQSDRGHFSPGDLSFAYQDHLVWLSALTTVTCMARLCGRNRPRSDRRWKRETATAREAEVMDGKAIAGQVREESWEKFPCSFFNPKRVGFHEKYC